MLSIAEVVKKSDLTSSNFITLISKSLMKLHSRTDDYLQANINC